MDPPVVSTAAPTSSPPPGQLFYYETYDASSGLLGAGWVTSAEDGWGAGRMAATTTNETTMTRIYDYMKQTWVAWITANPPTIDASGAPTTATSDGSIPTWLVAAAGFGVVGAVIYLLTRR